MKAVGQLFGRIILPGCKPNDNDIRQSIAGLLKMETMAGEKKVVHDGDFVLRQNAGLFGHYATVDSNVEDGVVALDGPIAENNEEGVLKLFSGIPGISVQNNATVK